MQQNYRNSRGNKIPLRKRARNFLSFLALLSIALNLLVPVTHSLAANAEATEFLEICTNQGIQLVEVLVHPDVPDSVDTMGSQCSACPDCPMCPAEKTTSLLLFNQAKLEFPLETSAKAHSGKRAVDKKSNALWHRPALRAPPSI